MQKSAFVLLSLLLSIAANLCAQESPKPYAEDQLFEPPPYSFNIIYDIRLPNRNNIRIELANGNDLHNLRNIDSLLTTFLNDMTTFRDSLSDPLTIKHLDYLIDTTNIHKLRIRQYRPSATTFLLDRPEPAILRIQQDTIRILLMSRPHGANPGLTVKGLRYDRISFFVNHYSEIETLAAKGLNPQIASILTRQRATSASDPHLIHYSINDSVVTTDIPDRQHDKLELNANIAAGNYKSYFVPAFDLNAGVTLNHNPVEYHFGASWEPLFFFATNAQDHLQTYRNDLVVLNFERTRQNKGKDHPKPNLSIEPAFSFGYVVHREGDYFTQPSFRLTLLGGKALGGLVRFTPGLYFNGFFKGVTPCLRLSFGGF